MKAKPHRLCFAKKAAAFFRMSRSSAASRFSLRSRASSSRSAVVRPGLALGAIGPRVLDPLAQRRLGQIEVAGDGADRLAFIEHQPDGAGLELVSELPARPPSACVSAMVWTSYPPFGRCPPNRIKPTPGSEQSYGAQMLVASSSKQTTQRSLPRSRAPRPSPRPSRACTDRHR